MSKYVELEHAQTVLDCWLEEGATYAELMNEMEAHIERLLGDIKLSYLDRPGSSVFYAEEVGKFIKAIQQLKERGE